MGKALAMGMMMTVMAKASKFGVDEDGDGRQMVGGSVQPPQSAEGAMLEP
jgi:hypothetical protein